jgi:uncharacterized membrane protein
MAEFLRLLLGTVIYRPYVYGFFVCFMVFALRHLKWRGVLIYLPLAFLIAFASEYSATRNGFPFGIYTYIDTTRTRELWLSNIPFWDSLSFVFLSYFSWIVASLTLDPRDARTKLLEPRTAVLAGLLMMLLDVVIDPLTLQGEKWFLGRIYFYPHGGFYFGVTIANFIGWWFVGAITVFIVQRLALVLPGLDVNKNNGSLSRAQALGCLGVYAGVFTFNLVMTAVIGDTTLLACSAAVALVTLGSCGYRIVTRSNSLARRPS